MPGRVGSLPGAELLRVDEALGAQGAELLVAGEGDHATFVRSVLSQVVYPTDAVVRLDVLAQVLAWL